MASTAGFIRMPPHCVRAERQEYKTASDVSGWTGREVHKIEQSNAEYMHVRASDAARARAIEGSMHRAIIIHFPVLCPLSCASMFGGTGTPFGTPVAPAFGQQQQTSAFGTPQQTAPSPFGAQQQPAASPFGSSSALGVPAASAFGSQQSGFGAPAAAFGSAPAAFGASSFGAQPASPAAGAPAASFGFGASPSGAPRSRPPARS